MKRPFYVFDFDGTLTNNQKRCKYYLDRPEPDWEGYWATALEDEPNKAVTYAATVIRGLFDVEVWTARSERMRVDTQYLVNRWLGNGVPIRMRALGDMRPNSIVKAEFIEKYGTPIAIFEDEHAVVKMWRDKNIPCFQVSDVAF